ncbi:MAG: YicC family protein [Flavobacteriaceae bacterium]|nr:YicC family protein [Flavobacteriaceae bacterium]MBT3754548.1 YicC family protein [Flavobacteriaceae bacterium]MBT4415427.1 YicC family protein [Flavobacteriaceae bacterium]MBT5012259.1 YicC family protein [Flavobacteriaceae bacterium]MBT5596844.1 YicC family protein [Flavobacteriaceae bacterium]
MLHSMTGFGKASLDSNLGKISIEFKSLNSKNIDINFNIPSLFKSMENDLRVVVSNKIKRGKVDCKFNLSLDSENFSSQLNHKIIKKYIIDLKKIVDANETELLKIAVKLPEALSKPPTNLNKQIIEDIKKIVLVAINELIDFRIQEGKSMELDLLKNLSSIEKNLEKVKTFAPERSKSLKKRLNNNLKELKIEIDNNRFEQEIIFYLEKYDINEEITRLENHVNFFKKTMKHSNIEKGKKLAFIGQEIGREINTIGSKSNHALMQQAVVEMKNDLEKIKEQLFNVL